MKRGANGNQVGILCGRARRLLFCAFVVMMAAAASAHAITTYSGVAVTSGGPINGWGVTDAYVSGMHHTAYVSTSLRSPKARNSSSGWRNATSTVRADVSLLWDSTDLGSYLETSNHKYYCDAAMRFFVLANTTGSTTVPYVVLSLRTSGLVFLDNSGLSEYQREEGTNSLGVFYFTGISPDQHDRGWRTGVEIDGLVLPTSYTGNIYIKRWIIEKDVYNGCTYVPGEHQVNVDDTTPIGSHLQDYEPQSGGSRGWVYDLDAPWLGFTDAAPAGSLFRKRVNFKQWAVILDAQMKEVKVSGDLPWFSRLSVYKNGDGTTSLEASFANDNMAGSGPTKLSCSLQ